MAAFTEVVNKMTNEELDMLMKGEGSLKFAARNQRVKTAKLKYNVIDVGDIAKKLSNATNLEEAMEVLATIPKSGRRKYLAELATTFRVYITKRDTISSIEEKIIESVVGARMRSEAMLSLPF